MKITKIATVLPIAFALTVCGAFAAGGTDTADNASSQYQLTLADYVKITTSTEELTSDTTFGTDYGSINIDAAMAAKFNVISNAKTRKLYLTAACPVNGTATPLYGADEYCQNLKLVFTHTTNIPAADSVTNITSGTPVVDSNPNAIAFAVTAQTTHQHGPTETPLTAKWDGDNQRIEYTMKNGVADFTYTISGQNEAKTFNTQDMSGTYQATLTMTDMSAI